MKKHPNFQKDFLILEQEQLDDLESQDEFPQSHTEKWILSYADIMTILFGFFVFMYVLSTRSQQKQETTPANHNLQNIISPVSENAEVILDMSNSQNLFEKDREIQSLQKKIQRLEQEVETLRDKKISSHPEDKERN